MNRIFYILSAFLVLIVFALLNSIFFGKNSYHQKSILVEQTNHQIIKNDDLKKQNEIKYDISMMEVFEKFKDQELKNYLKYKSSGLNGRIIDLENYLQALQNVVQLISTDYKKLD